MKHLHLLAVAAALACPPVLADVVGSLLKQYETQGATSFAAANAEAMWTRAFADSKSGEKRRCSSCHHEDLRRTGKHAVTGKVIEPLAPSANPKRLTDAEHIEKWFSRNWSRISSSCFRERTARKICQARRSSIVAAP